MSLCANNAPTAVSGISNKWLTNKPYITKQCDKSSVAEPYVAKPYN